MLELKNIYKNYLVDKKPFPALKNINLNFDKKGFVSILGPSGCGKTTLLNLIGGLDQYTSGDLIINNKSTKHFTDKDWDAYRNKRVGFVFQTYNLVPHLTIQGNVEISMALSGISKRARAKRALKALEQVGLKDIAKKKPNQLSGGQMQRVAIARSLVNNPEIILADEPTGALDSVTSVQVMEILKEVSKTRLVIMVTHNTELADRYSTRIIRLKDGVIISDSKPERLKHAKEQKVELEDNKHTHMSFMTALASSAKSLLTKKGRTILTATAASFGIIGVAIVLAMSNGFSSYVHNVEIATASTVPINISPYVAATNQQEQTVTREAWPDDTNIYPFDDSLSGAVAMHRNKITQDYANYCMKLLEKPQHYASSVLENHEGLDFNIFTTRPTIGDPEIIKIDQYSSGGTTGMLLADVGGLPSSIFHELYGGEDYIMSIYDVVAGKYPHGKNEVCLVCDRWNRIPNETLIKLGYLPDDGSEEYDPISFNNLLGKTYKAFLPKDVYGEPIENDVSCKKLKYDSSTHETSLAQFEDGPSTQTITQFYDVCKDKTALKTLYDDEDHKSTEIKVVGIIRPSKTSLINLMPGSVCYTSELKDYYISEINKEENDVYREAAKNNWCIKSSVSQTDWFTILADIRATGSFAKLSQALEFYPLFTDQTGTYTPTPISPTDTTSSAYNVYETYAYKIATEFDHDFINHIDINRACLTNDATLADLLAYANGYSTITSILVFPKDLTNKPKIFEYLDHYNDNLSEEDKILYQDIAGAITDTIGTMIDVISTILIAFSSISLLVSCVMTGIITYTSVLERTKEIGILRAIGARKKDVGRLFEAEAVIVGGIGGLIGVIFTFMVEVPVSILIAHRFPIQNIGMICNLNPLHALLLVGVSILLTFVAGFIPARKAAKKDPVVALRTE